MDNLIHLLKITLGTVFVFYGKAHACHWNVEGSLFISLHKLFGEIYQDTWESVDDIAEQIRQLDAYAPASLERFIELSRIKGINEVLTSHEMLLMLVKDTETLLAVLTESLHAAEAEDKQGLVNFLASRIEAHNKWRWQLRSSAKITIK
jgi:starvation-inducible DNA-binding protein